MAVNTSGRRVVSVDAAHSVPTRRGGQGKSIDKMAVDRLKAMLSLPSKPRSAIRKKLLILSTPRSGSTLFCDILTHSDRCGDPQEWFNPLFINAYRAQYGRVSLADYSDTLLRKTVTDNGVFAVNVQVDQHRDCCAEQFDIFDIGFDYVVYLYRKNKIAQAFSHARALASGRWLAAAAPLHSDAPELPSRHQIACSLAHLLEQESYYDRHLRRRVEASFCYEDFGDIYRTRAFVDLLELIGESGDRFFPQTTMRRQRSARSAKAGKQFAHYILGR